MRKLWIRAVGVVIPSLFKKKWINGFLELQNTPKNYLLESTLSPNGPNILKPCSVIGLENPLVQKLIFNSKNITILKLEFSPHVLIQFMESQLCSWHPITNLLTN